MKVTVSQLRSIIQETLNESPPTRRGLGKNFNPSSDDYPAGVPTQRGMGLDATIDSLFSAWDKHMGRDPKAADRDVPVDDFGYACATCGEPMAPDQVSCPNCDAVSRAAPRTMRSPGVSEMKLSIAAGGQTPPSMDDLFLVPADFERDTDADDEEDRRLDRDPDMQYADLAFDPRRRRM